MLCEFNMDSVGRHSLLELASSGRSRNCNPSVSDCFHPRTVHVTPITLWGRGQNHPLRFRSGVFFFFICRSLLSSLSSKALSAVSCNLQYYPRTVEAEMVWLCACGWRGKVEGLVKGNRSTEFVDSEAHLWPRPSPSLCTFLFMSHHISFPVLCRCSDQQPYGQWAVPHTMLHLC